MSVIKIELSDWLKNAGIIGLVNILESSSELKNKVNRRNNFIEFDSSELDNFHQLYFEYLINKYKAFISIEKIISKEEWIKDLLDKGINEKGLDSLNIYIKYLKERLKSASYKSAYEILSDSNYNLLDKSALLKELKLKKKQNISDINSDFKAQCNFILEIIEYLNKPQVRKIIAAKNVIYDVIQGFWSDVSFLNKNNSKLNMYECYKNDFVGPVKNYIEADFKKAKNTCFTCDNKIQKLSKPFAFDITWITKMGVDGSRKSSHFWNYYSDANICPICNLIYSCIPAAFSVINGKGLFINNNQSISNIISANAHVLNGNKTLDELEEETYFNIVDSMEQKSVEEAKSEVENIQVVKFDKNNASRPYTFNVLSKDKLLIIKNNKKILQQLLNKKVKLAKDYYLNIYSAVVDRIYNGKNLFDLLDTLTRLRISGEYKNSYVIYLLIKLNDDCIGMRGGSRVYQKNIDKFKDYGINLKKKYEKEGGNKIPGILYRLQNALKVKDVSRFMDTLINAYTSKKQPIPVDFVQALQDIDKFQTIGYAFLIGLQGMEVPRHNEENNINKEV
ncbi:CRISPR-associated protein [Clostridium saccharobutylicum]|uniref:type I-B CRISPR-associated protein Cas8b1/Cst1 n=1 Tax=Clostridium saccharobutylicum TaxID=169679 RepID=UPI000983D1F5|nr:type I-B CRISPR-associated protein Cas8b1/Cst1 [Clostridium saccharobutylicum]AQS10332.1 CRISPR-associated protein [Clostridium saccharobutylicum]MBC2438703.1 type I-B CRISPR-associated protein Cas8b1/Cst1 [Clostridium saccharobutylicum]NSB87729.1 CRISPR-associated protein Cst1 [Clostridium saccharobutylicum]NYC31271.1 CRISPR-associated protein Cst1 [Clostridium saccharobutylicum]OOM19194.1 CRISPR-associated protein [Clostridium saccharobutylicum]